MLSENDFKRRVIDTAMLYGWRVCHFRPARTRRGWATPIEGHAGMPDLVLAKGGRVLLVELKSDTGRVEPEQRKWLDASGANGLLWAPRDWPQALAILSGQE